MYLNNRAMLNKVMKMGRRPVICVAQDYIKHVVVDDPRVRKAPTLTFSPCFNMTVTPLEYSIN